MAIPTVVAVGTAASGTGDVVPGLPSGWGENDIFVAQRETITGEGSTLPSGWAHVTGSPVVEAASNLTVAWRRATASESDPIFADVGDHQIARIVGIRGCPTSGDPWNVIATDTGAASTTVTIPGATTTVADCLVLACFSTGRDIASTTNVSGWANADLANLAEQMDNWTDAGGGGGIGLATGEKATAGAYAATTATQGGTNAQARMSIALKPVVTAVSTTRDLVYTVIQAITAPRELKYSIYQAIPATRALTYGILNAVAADRELKYSIYQAVTADRALVYTVIQAITASRALQYSIIQAIAADRALTYNVLNSVAASRETTYHILNSVAADRALVYSIVQALTASRALVYSIGDAPDDPYREWQRRKKLYQPTVFTFADD